MASLTVENWLRFFRLAADWSGGISTLWAQTQRFFPNLNLQAAAAHRRSALMPSPYPARTSSRWLFLFSSAPPELLLRLGRKNAERIITNKAVDTLPDEMHAYFDANRQYLVQHVIDPGDASDKNPPNARNGFIRLDHYGPFPFSVLPRSGSMAAVAKYTRRTVETYGLLPWQIGISSQKLTEAFQEGTIWGDVRLSAADSRALCRRRARSLQHHRG